MANMTIRNIDDETMRWLRMSAATHGQSINSEVLDILHVMRADELAARHPDHPISRTLKRARKLGVRTPATSAAIVRSDRNRR